MVDAPEPAARHGLYESSSQYKHWRFSPAQLQHMRESLTNNAVATVRAAFERDEPGSSARIEFLAAADEVALVRYYATKIPQLCAHFRFSEEIEATGVSYMKRFYLRNTVMDHHPKNIMLTALFLAAKTCNRMVSIDDYVARIPKTTAADVLELEFPVAQSLDFEFAVWHAHRALWGMYLDMQSLVPKPERDALDALYRPAMDAVRRSRLTDAELLYSPAQIAFAALRGADAQLAERWLMSKGERDPAVTMDGTLLALADSIARLVEADGEPPSVDGVREIDRRLKLCKNPEKVPGSRAFLRRQAELEAIAAAKRKRKADKARAVMAANDPFGNGPTASNANGANGGEGGMEVDI